MTNQDILSSVTCHREELIGLACFDINFESMLDILDIGKPEWKNEHEKFIASFTMVLHQKHNMPFEALEFIQEKMIDYATKFPVSGCKEACETCLTIRLLCLGDNRRPASKIYTLSSST